MVFDACHLYTPQVSYERCPLCQETAGLSEAELAEWLSDGPDSTVAWVRRPQDLQDG
jgi:hypothetical protein